MNWKLLFTLSLFGLAIGLGSAFVLSNMAELLCWLAAFIICAYFIAKNAPGKYFLHGFVLSLFNCIWVTAVHVLFVTDFMANHPEMANNGGMPLHGHVRLNMIILGPIIGAGFGLILGLFAFIAGKLVKKSTVTAS